MYKTPSKPGFAGAILWRSVLVQFGSILVGCIAATQYIANRMDEQAALGPALFHILGVGIYPPWMFLLWIWKFIGDDDRTVRMTFLIALLGVFVGSAVFGAITSRILRALYIRKQSKDTEDIHGSAHFANKKDLERAGLLGKTVGLFVGGWHDAVDKILRYLRHDGPESVCVIAPPRSGKGVSLVVPILLDHPANMLVHDTKMELYHLTAGYREKELGQKVLLFAPTEPETCGYNPLAEIRLGTEREVSDAQNIVNLLVRTGAEHAGNKHWDDTAESFGLGLVLHCCYVAKQAGRTATLADVYNMLTPFGMTLQEYLEAALNYPHDPTMKHGWMTPDGLPAATHPVVRQKFQEHLGRHHEYQTSVVGSFSAALVVFSDPLVGRATAKSDFLMRDLANFEKPMTVYIAIPPSDMKRLRPLLRLFFSLALLKNMERMDASRPPALPHERLVLMVDEAGQIGKMDILDTSLPTMPGYNIQAYLIFHSIEQIKELYGYSNNIIAATHVRIAFAPNTRDTAKELSDMTGETTIARQAYSFSGQRGAIYGPKQMSGHTEYTRRALLTPDEVMRMRGIQKVEGKLLPGDMLIFLAGHPPIFGTQTLYLANPELVRRSQIKRTADKGVPPPFTLQQKLSEIVEGEHAAV